MGTESLTSDPKDLSWFLGSMLGNAVGPAARGLFIRNVLLVFRRAAGGTSFTSARMNLFSPRPVPNVKGECDMVYYDVSKEGHQQHGQYVRKAQF
jgi:hypothetical protein